MSRNVFWMLCAMGCGAPHPLLNTAAGDSLALPEPPADSLRGRLPGRSLLIVDATLIDGRGGPPLHGMDVWVEDGLIRQIGVDLEVPALPSIDATGLSLLPGLITSHAHLQSVPGSVLRQDSAASIRIQNFKTK